MGKVVRITHAPTGPVIAEGPLGWGVTPFEGNYYIRKKHLKTDRFRRTFAIGFCPYKFLYVWLDLVPPDGLPVRALGWYYWLPNPLLPCIAFGVAVPGDHPELAIEHIRDRTRISGNRTWRRSRMW
jgi:uncharacterized protein (DUF427 family)